MEALKNLGIDGSAMLAQAVNFGLLLFILYRFLYKPVLKMLNTRSQTIEESLKNAEEIELRLSKIDLEKENILKATEKEAEKIIQQAKVENEELKKAIIASAEEKSEKLIEQAKKAIEKEKTAMMKSVKEEIAGLVEASLHLIVEENQEEIDKKLVRDAIASVSKEG